MLGHVVVASLEGSHLRMEACFLGRFSLFLKIGMTAISFILHLGVDVERCDAWSSCSHLVATRGVLDGLSKGAGVERQNEPGSSKSLEGAFLRLD